VTTPDLDAFVQRLTEVRQSKKKSFLFAFFDTYHLLRWSRASIRDVESDLAKAVMIRTETLEALGETVAESPEEFLISGIFDFKTAIADVEDEKMVSEHQSAQLGDQLALERQRYSETVRLLRARLAGLKATDESLRKDAPASADVPDPLASERQKLSEQIGELSQKLDQVEAQGNQAISKLQREWQKESDRTQQLEQRAGSIRRDLGRALLENQSKDDVNPQAQAAMAATETVQSLLHLRTSWRREADKIDTSPVLHFVSFFLMIIMVLGIFFAVF